MISVPLLKPAATRKLNPMKRLRRTLSTLASLALLLDTAFTHAAEPTPANLTAFNAYSQAIETRLAQQHASTTNFLALNPTQLPSLRSGQLLVENLTPSNPPSSLDGALLHHWRATAFAPGATVAGFEHLLRNFNAYPQTFAPEVLQSHALTQAPDHLLTTMRVRQHHILTVILDLTDDVTFAQPNPTHGYSLSRSTRIDEIANPNTPADHPLAPADNHGFLYRQNTYWSYEQRDGGLYLQLESISLTRAIPTGLAWAIRPFTDSIPRESLEFTLRSAIHAIRQ